MRVAIANRVVGHRTEAITINNLVLVVTIFYA